MENLNQNQNSNQIVGIPRPDHEGSNELEQAGMPVTPSLTPSLEEGILINSEEAKVSEAKIQSVEISETKLKTARKILINLKDSLDAALGLLVDEASLKPALKEDTTLTVLPNLYLIEGLHDPKPQAFGKIVEGVFDGEHMVSSEGQIYNIPPNYASKSKLVEGDLLKLTITPKGAFIYKQIGPIERERVHGLLITNQDADGEYAVAVGEKVYRVLKASVTYFKGNEGDEVVLLVPKNASSRWAAVENIIKKVL